MIQRILEQFRRLFATGSTPSAATAQGVVQQQVEHLHAGEAVERLQAGKAVEPLQAGEVEAPDGMFSFSDVLTFFSIGYECHHKGMATLAGILLTSDAINRSTPSREELEGSLTRLLAAGYIAASSGSYLITPEGKAVYDDVVQTPGMTVFDKLAEVQRRLSEGPLPAKVLEVVVITKEQFRDAEEGAEKRFEEISKQMGRGGA
jgi:hypothetical protein